MLNSPFKFLDSYTQSDKDIFFGREKETEEIYSRLFYSNLLLIYGPSGSGKTSLLQCGVANRFGEQDWKPIFVRRKTNILQSVHANLEKQAITPLKEPQSLKEKLYSIYLDYLTPVYLIFDQFEELFIFGTTDEKQEFIDELKIIIKSSDSNNHIIFSIREEYLAGLTEFEDEIPELFENRIRIEKMKKVQAQEAIESPCKVAGVELETGVSEKVLERLENKSGFIELTWLQVIMDGLYKKTEIRDIENICIQNKDLAQMGKMGDVLGNFLDEQLKNMEDGNKGESILKAMISSDGTKSQVTIEELNKSLKGLGYDYSRDEIQRILQHFINVRIISDKDESGRYEFKHDSIAAKIYEKLTLTEKELIEVRQFVEYAFQNYQTRGKNLSEDDLNYIAPYEGTLILSDTMTRFILDSRKALIKDRRRKRNIWISIGLILLIIMLGFSWWANRERANAVKQKAFAEEQKKIAQEQKVIAEKQKEQAQTANMIAEMAKDTALRAKEIVEKELYNSIMNSLSISPTSMNVLYRGIENPIDIAASGISNQKLIFYSNGLKLDASNNLPIVIHNPVRIVLKDNKYYVTDITHEVNELHIGAKGITSLGDTLDLGTKLFRVKKLPIPKVLIGNNDGGNISKDEILEQDGLSIDENTSLDVNYIVCGFMMLIPKGGGYFVAEKSNDRFFTEAMSTQIKSTKKGDMIIVQNIMLEGPQGDVKAPSLAFTVEGSIIDEENEIKSNINALIKEAYQELEANPSLSYRMAEAAYFIDKNDSSARDAIINTFAYAFSINDLIDGSDDFDAVWVSSNTEHIVFSKNKLSRYIQKGDTTMLLVSIDNQSISKRMIIDIPGNNLVFSEGGDRFLVNDNSGKLFWDGIKFFNFNGNLITSFHTGKFNAEICDFYNDGLFIVQHFYGFKLLEAKGKEIVKVKVDKRIHGQISCVASTIERDVFVTGHTNGYINIYNSNGEIISQTSMLDNVNQISISSKNETFLACSYENIWLLSFDGTLIKEYLGNKGLTSSVSFSTDEKKIITTGYDFTVRIWDINGALLSLIKVPASFSVYHKPKAWFSKDMKYILYRSGRIFKKIPLDPEEIIHTINISKLYGEVPELTND